MREPFQRTSVYVYAAWKLSPGWSVIAGMSGDWLKFPTNLYTEPITPGHARTTRGSPKVGAIWEPNRRWIVRAAHSEAVGGVTFEESFRLEPVQFGGFTQGVRSLIPEAVAGSTVAPQFALDGVGVSLQGRASHPSGRRSAGATIERGSPPRRLRGGSPTAHMRVVDEQSHVARAPAHGERDLVCDPAVDRLRWRRWLDTLVEQTFPIARALALRQRSRLFAPTVRLSWNSPEGFFGRTESTWLHQNETSAPPHHPTADGTAMWRSVIAHARNVWTASVGAMNLWNTDLTFGALTVPRPLSLQRAFFVRTTWSF